MTELQRKEFELLKLFVSICEKHQLMYYLVCGSALGAVKYDGFIPWDDDIDVALPRKDYEQFLSIAAVELPEWVFIQNYRTDSEFPLLGTKLRDSNTTYIESWCSTMKMHHGIFIDVFPLDGYPEKVEDQERFEKRKKYYWRRRCTHLSRWLHRDIGLTLCSMGHYFLGLYPDTSKYVRENEEMLMENDLENSQLWCNFANSMSKLEYAHRKQYGDGVWAIFEGLKVRIPEQYDAYLTQKYGKWREDPPVKEQLGHHYYKVVDIERPYTEHVKKQ